jgi:hypothetical protein
MAASPEAIAVGISKSDTPTPAPSPTATYPPFLLGYETLGSAWAGEHSDTVSTPGEVKTYAHYPTNHIQYDRVIVKGVLERVVLVCRDTTTELTGVFERIADAPTASGEIVYKSWEIQIQQGCQIDFSIRHTQGPTVGLKFEAHCPVCRRDED